MTDLVSTGGLGDAFIVGLKIREWILDGDKGDIDWLHVESNDLSKPIKDVFNLFDGLGIHFGFDHDPDYIQNLREHLEGRVLIPTPVRGECEFHKAKWELENCAFLDPHGLSKEFDVVLQSEAGVNNGRSWEGGTASVALLLTSLGHDVTIIGTSLGDEDLSKYPKITDLRGKTSLSEAFNIIRKCEIFVGLSGLLNYFACASRVKNIHVMESKKHEKIYYHPDWQKYTVPILTSHLHSVARGVRLVKSLEAEGE